MIHHRSGFFRMIYSHPITIVFNSIQFFDWWSEFNLLYLVHHYHHNHVIDKSSLSLFFIFKNDDYTDHSNHYNHNEFSTTIDGVCKTKLSTIKRCNISGKFFFVLIVYLKISKVSSHYWGHKQTNKKKGISYFIQMLGHHIYNNYDLTEQFYL